MVPYFDPLFCEVVRWLHRLDGVQQVELLLPVHTQRYQPVQLKKLQFWSTQLLPAQRGVVA